VQSLEDRAGSARVVLRDAETGELVDRLEVRIERVVRISPISPLPHLTMAGARRAVPGWLTAATGEELVGFGALDTSARGPLALVAGEREHFLASQEGLVVDALAPGVGVVTLSAPAATPVVLVHEVVDPSAITRVEIPWDERSWFAFAGSPFSVTAVAWAEDELVSSPVCSWSLEPTDGAIQITEVGRDRVTLLSPSPTRATIRCEIGGASDDATILVQ
jgi:hypothetical protein